jgi:uncharacterized Rossmann fold enzyme
VSTRRNITVKPDSIQNKNQEMSIRRTGAGQRFIKPDRKIITESTVRKDPNQIDARKHATIEQRINKISERIGVPSGETHTSNISELFSKKNSDTVFIIGGGPSLKDFDFSSLIDQDTMCVNKAVEFVPNPTYFITMDYTYLTKTKTPISHFSKNGTATVFIINTSGSVKLNTKNKYFDNRVGLEYSRLNEFNFTIESDSIIDKNTGFSTNVSTFSHGENSGFCAIQLALILGYEKICLLGFDMNSKNGTHFHNHYLNKTNIKERISSYKETLESAIRLNKNKAKIFSCSASSSLNSSIKYVNFQEMLQGNFQQPVEKDLSDLLIVGYYTISTPYEDEAKKLIASCNKIGIQHDIKGVQNLGSWQSNTRYKAKFMLDMLLKHPDKRLLYVDCDAVIHSLPVLFKNYSADVAVRFQDFNWRKNECLSGTIYMENNLKTRRLCELWAKENISEGVNAKTFEQWNLAKAIEQMGKTDGLVCKNLPPEYTFIFDSMRKIYPGAVPVIEHFQASRKFKNKV